MGRKKLSVIKRLEGNRSRVQIQESGIEALGDPFVCNHILDEAKACLEAVISSMPPGVYRKMDSFALAAYGMAWGIHKRAAEEVSKPDFEYVQVNSNGIQYQSPWLKILNEQHQHLMAAGARLGLDPLARQGLQLPEQRSKSRFRGLIGPEIEQAASSPSLKNSQSPAE